MHTCVRAAHRENPASSVSQPGPNAGKLGTHLSAARPMV